MFTRAPRPAPTSPAQPERGCTLMFPPWLIVVAFAAAVVFLLLSGAVAIATYRYRKRRDAERAAGERVTDPGLSAAWTHSRTHPQATREPFTLDTDGDDGRRLRPALRRQQDEGDAG